MANLSRFLSRFFNFSRKTAGDRTSEVSEVDENQARVRIPAALPEEIVRQFSLSEIKAATHNFHKDLIVGRGGLGTVYKGFFYDGNLVAAVKRSDRNSRKACSEFLNEGQLLCQLRHQNLMAIIGFCNHNDEMFLVYEYMRNRTLRDHLYGSGYDPLPWKQRLEICIGVARGLHYLHSGAKQAVIHRNIQSTNILLDDKWACKLSYFGWSKMRPRSQSKALEKIDSSVKGTFGYLDPEYYRKKELTEKSDVYSFGVVLFEVLCARKAFDTELARNQVNLAEWARRSIGEGTIYKIIDPYVKGRIAPECFKELVDIAWSCTCLEGNRRPDMGEVEVMLERAFELQEKADSDMVHLAPCGKYMYEEESVCAFLPVYSSGVEDDRHSGITSPTSDLSSLSTDSE